MFRHQIILHPDIAGQFTVERSITPYQSQQGFAWYLCPAEVSDEQVWLLVNVEFGYVELLEQVDFSAEAIELAVLEVIEHHSGQEENNVSVSLNPDDITWHTSDKIPSHVGQRYQQALELLFDCLDMDAAHDALEQLNNRPWGISGLAPSQGLAGLLLA